MSEIWKPIPEYPGYDVSDHGQVRSYYKRVKNDGRGGAWKIADTPQRIMAGGSDGRYLYQFIKHESGEFRNVKTHVLIMLAFVGECPDGLEVCHNDNIKYNNRLDNLRYDTHANNMLDAAHAGGTGGRKLTNDQALKARQRYRDGESRDALEKELGVSRKNLSNCLRGKTFAHLGSENTVEYVRRITDTQVREMRELRQGGALLKELAERYNLDISAVSRLVRGMFRVKSGGPIDAGRILTNREK